MLANAQEIYLFYILTVMHFRIDHLFVQLQHQFRLHFPCRAKLISLLS